MKREIPICKKCAFYCGERMLGGPFCSLAAEPHTDLVDGHRYWEDLPLCSEQRRETGGCGPDGLGFEKRPGLIKTLLSLLWK
jgi:hypothetical protein